MNPDEAATYARIAAHVRDQIELAERIAPVDAVVMVVPNETIAYHVRSELTLADAARLRFMWPGRTTATVVPPRPPQEQSA